MTILEIQKALKTLGYDPGVLDGKSGPKTLAAIKAFQTNQKLVSDGIAGAKTQSAIQVALDKKILVPVNPPIPIKHKEYDAISLQRLQTIHPKLRDEAIRLFKEAADKLTGRSTLRVAYALRTIAEQQAIYNQGRTTPGKIVTNARPLYSNHNFGLAFDFVLMLDGKEASWDIDDDFDGDLIADWMEVVRVFAAAGWDWGGNWKSLKDYPHLEKLFGYPTSNLRTKYLNKQFIPGTTYVMI